MGLQTPLAWSYQLSVPTVQYVSRSSRHFELRKNNCVDVYCQVHHERHDPSMHKNCDDALTDVNIRPGQGHRLSSTSSSQRTVTLNNSCYLMYLYHKNYIMPCHPIMILCVFPRTPFCMFSCACFYRCVCHLVRP
jgi:hypothetical protein